jgi:hypothetical protein
LSAPESPPLSPSQLAVLAEIGEERSAPVGELLYRVGDRTYPFVVILEGEVAIIDAAGNELIRHGPAGFLGEVNLLSGQTVFVNALVTKPLRYIAVERSDLRSLLNEDGPLSDLVLSTFISRREALQTAEGVGVEIVGPHGSEQTMRMLEFVRANRLPYSWEDAGPPGGGELPLVRLPGGGELRGPTPGEVSRRVRMSTCSSSEAGRRVWLPRSTAHLKGSTRSSSRAPRSVARPGRPAGSRTTSAFPLELAAPSSRAAQ